jgi:malate synthase
MATSSAARIEGAERVLTAPAVAFVEDLTRRFRPRIDELLARRRGVQQRYNQGERPEFLAETAEVRRGTWKVASIPADLHDRRVEITGPVDRKMIINALNSGASMFMADFEDANSPTWANIVSGQANLIDAVRRTITYENPDTGKRYKLNPRFRRCSCGRAASICPSATSPSTSAPRRACCSTSACTCFTTRRRWPPPERVPTSTCRRCRATSRRGCGTTYSSTRRRR